MFEGISLIPNQGSQTQKIPPITSVNDKRVNSAAGIVFDPIEYNINPKQTKVPWTENKAWFLVVDKKLRSWFKIIKPEKVAQIKPAEATVVNFGVSFLHLKDTEKIAKPKAEVIPNTSPEIDPLLSLSNAIISIPIEATIIDSQTLKDIFSFKNKKPNNAVINGIAAKHKRVTAAEVFVIDQIKDIIATASPIPPINPETPILR